ncbi:hypothetical protein M8C13_31635 [Crossiella sp. SN42]|uniref:wHTH domain-containing protein n=1 Tax=Crossiella sp. SN42 TaxID=2944808 RepID=UPI00207C15E9|nr:hypothetical protein [Crossiella sp. SN42]MCO1580319.1 hypothetical protein [Crossiella sp. SN42]
MDRSHTYNLIINSSITGSDVVQARDIGAAPAAEADIWRHVHPAADAALYRERTAEVVTRLSEIRQAVDTVLAADPWQDPGYPARFLHELHWLLGDMELSAAEAAVLVLLPFLRVTHDRRLAAALSGVRPAELTPEPGDEAERAEFDSFAAGFAPLRERARLRPEAAPAIGWWLFHRWLRHRNPAAEPGQVAKLLNLLGEPALALEETFAAERMFLLLQGLRRGPGVCNPEFLGNFPAEDRLRAPGRQKLRGRQLALLAALAHGMAIELTALPEVVGEHLGIPHPVTPEDLRRTLAAVKWGGPPELPVLTARCEHEAVVEALREHTARLDELLHEAHLAAGAPLAKTLPTRFSADQVTGTFAGYARFRHSSTGVRSLLMGVQLYKDPDLAIRELYQNALDACRYRTARTEYLDRTHPATYDYTGRIRFEQGVDDQGRHYVDCHDNGIGMGTAELRGVFCDATARFTDQDDYRHELARWQQLAPPVTLYPNSRFGIGVFSYFMLADEILVTTCRMGMDGIPGPVLEAAIHGPGHLFRIEQRAERGAEPGTRVRLYLRDPERWSCVEVLERLLGIAEFETTAEDGDRVETWAPRRLRSRKAPEERFGLNAYGELVPWDGAPAGIQVIWCEHGGGVLVDGLVVEPSERRPPFGTSSSGLSGVVVNLFGPAAPRKLSADRTEVQDEDLPSRVGEVLEVAIGPLIAMNGSLPSYGWICELARTNVALADHFTLATAEAGLQLQGGSFTFDMTRAGCFSRDWHILNKYGVRQGIANLAKWVGATHFPVPDHILLWRLLANRVTQALRVLTALDPTLSEVTVRVARPSDEMLLVLDRQGGWLDQWTSVSDQDIASFAHRMGVTSTEVSAVARQLGFDSASTSAGTPRPAEVDDLRKAQRSWQVNAEEVARQWRARGIDVPEAVVRIVANGEDTWFLQPDPEDQYYWLDPNSAVPAGHLALASLNSGRPVSEVRTRLEQLGFRVDTVNLPEYPQAEVVTLLSGNRTRRSRWLTRGEPVPPGHIMRSSADLGMSVATVLEQLERFGFEVPVLPANATAAEHVLLGDYQLSGPIPAQHLVRSADVLGVTISQVVGRLRDYGFLIEVDPPAQPSPDERNLFGPRGPMRWADVTSNTSITLAEVVVAAVELRMPLEEAVRHVTHYGFSLSATELPDGLTFDLACELLECQAVEGGSVISRIDNSLEEFLDGALRLGVSIDQLVSWWRGLGIDVPDPRIALRAALARVPRA